MLPLGRSFSCHILLAEYLGAQYRPEGAAALLQDLLAVGDEEQRTDLAACLKPPVVECGNNGLARPSRRYDEIPFVTPKLPRHLQVVEDLSLEVLRHDVEHGQERATVIGSLAAGATKGVPQARLVLGCADVGDKAR